MIIELDTSEFDKVRALVKQWPKRAKAVRKQFLYRAVYTTFEDLESFLPSGLIRRSMGIRAVRGLPDKADGYIIRSAPRGRTVTKKEGETEVIYVSAKKNLMRKVPKETQLLEEYSPWTTDTLPYSPDTKTAEVMSRRVSRREVVRVRKMRKRDRPEWRRRMTEAGIRFETPVFAPKPREVNAIADVAFESLRLEFGLGGEPSKPHWRKSILKLAQRGRAGMIARKREFVRAMTDKTFRGWEMWPRPPEGYVTVAEARKYVPFQKRLGIRVRKG